MEETSTETTMDVINHLMKERDKFNKKVMEDEQMLEAGKLNGHTRLTVKARCSAETL